MIVANHSEIMPISVSDAERMCMSIRLRSGGLAFALWSGEVGSHLHSEYYLSIDRGHHSLYEAVQELFYQNELLSLPYYSVTLFYRPELITLAPREHYRHGHAEVWLESVSTRRQGDEEAPMALPYIYPDEPKVLIGAFSNQLYQFLQRTHPRLEMIPEGVTTAEVYKRETRTQRSQAFYINLYAEGLDCWCIKEGMTTFANQYTFVHQDCADEMLGEIGYYTLALWRTLELSTERDKLVLAYTTDSDEATIALLQSLVDKTTAQLSVYLPIIEVQTYRLSQM